jgi:hypothetical protein
VHKVISHDDIAVCDQCDKNDGQGDEPVGAFVGQACEAEGQDYVSQDSLAEGQEFQAGGVIMSKKNISGLN